MLLDGLHLGGVVEKNSSLKILFLLWFVFPNVRSNKVVAINEHGSLALQSE